jgi:hypothetical protein
MRPPTQHYGDLTLSLDKNGVALERPCESEHDVDVIALDWEEIVWLLKVALPGAVSAARGVAADENRGTAS